MHAMKKTSNKLTLLAAFAYWSFLGYHTFYPEYDGGTLP
jgi:hypothetical protein